MARSVNRKCLECAALSAEAVQRVVLPPLRCGIGVPPVFKKLDAYFINF